MASALRKANCSAVWLGGLAESHADFSLLTALAAAVAESSGATLGFLPTAANAVGAALAGAMPHLGPGARPIGAPGLNALEQQHQPRSGYLLLGVEPGRDFWHAALSRHALAAAGGVVALTAYRSSVLEETADILLPIAGFAETSGTYINAAADWQSFTGAVAPQGEARPAWKVLRVLGNLLYLDGFDYTGSGQIRDELRGICDDLPPVMGVTELTDAQPHSSPDTLSRVGDVPIYAQDALVRRASSLQQTKDARPAQIRINAAEAKKWGLEAAEHAVAKQHDARVTLPVEIDERVPDGCAWISAAISGVEMLGEQFGDLLLEKA